MKKVVALTSAVLMAALALTGCAKKTNSASGKKVITVGYAQVGAESDWRLANTESFKSTFTAENGYRLIFNDAQQKQENQMKAMRSFIQQGVDYIVVAPVVETGWETVLEDCKKAGIPVILSDRMMDVADKSLYTCWVGGNFYKEGQDAVAWLEGYLKETGRDKSKINIAHIQGTIGASAQIGRTNGIVEGVAKHSNWNIILQQTGEFTQSKGQEVMESFLKQRTDIDVLFAENDNEAWGAIDAIKAAGKVPGKDIIIICFDAVGETFNRIIAGEINCAVECNPLHGPRVDSIIKGLENGVAPEKIAYVTEGVFDIKNAAKEKPNRKY